MKTKNICLNYNNFENAIPIGSFTIQTTSEKKASTQSLKLKIVKPATSTVVGKLLRIPLSPEGGTGGEES